MSNSSKRPWINAVMIDCVRITERYEYYRRLIPRLARWGANMLFWHFTDDEGCALKLASHPELSSRYALTREETVRLIRLAARHGIEVVPEVESLGHAKWITHLPQYEHLFEGSAGHFNALCPSHPEGLAIVRDVLTEVAEVFPSPWLHVGLDEVQFGPCPRCKRRGLPEWRLFADHLQAVHEIVAGLGKRMVLWGDHLVKDRRIARRVPREALVAHWDYFVQHPLAADHRGLLEMGFEALACPAAARVFTCILPDATNLANLRDFARVAQANRRRGSLGMVTTVWCPERQLGASTHLPMALGLAWAADPKAEAQTVAEGFVRHEFGLARPAAVARALLTLHDVSPSLLRLRKVFIEDPATHPDNEYYRMTAADVTDAEERRSAVAGAAKVLAAARPRVTQHRAEFAMYLDAAAIFDETLSRFGMWQDVALLDRLRQNMVRDGDLDEARNLAADVATILTGAAGGAGQSAQRAERDWKRLRHAEDPRRKGCDGYVRQKAALPGLLVRTAAALSRLAAKATRVARTGRGELGLPKSISTL